MRRSKLTPCALALVIGLASTVGLARACTFDGKPSAFADGRRAVLDTAPPGPATSAWGARFAFAQAFRTGQRVVFHEDDAQVRPVLPAADLHRGWRWRFGDGGGQPGDQVTHRYDRPGHYKISVDAYFAHYGWQPFDTIAITIKR